MKQLSKIVKADIEDMPVGGLLHCQSTPGFGARRQGPLAPVFFLEYRTADAARRRFTIGRFGQPWTVDSARKEAARLLHEIKVKGIDVQAVKQARREAPTVAELCIEYMEAAKTGAVLKRGGKAKKASTISTDKSRVEAHVLPLLGKLKVQAVTSRDIENFQKAVAAGKTAKREKLDKPYALSNRRGGKGAATRTVGLLGAIFAYAVKEGMRVDNPVRGVVRYADSKKERRLSDEEYAALGAALFALEAGDDAMWPPAIAAIRFLALTGWRSGEVINLRRHNLKQEGRLAVIDSKSDISARPLSKEAAAILRAQGEAEGDILLFPPTRGDGVMSGFPSFFERALKKARLDNTITPHVLRHSFISIAADLEYSESTIGALVGHTQHSVTGRYTHRADSVLLAAADAVAQEIGQRMGVMASDGKSNVLNFPGVEKTA